jgi:hypothetical protein
LCFVALFQQLHFAVFAAIRRASLLCSLVPYDVQSTEFLYSDQQTKAQHFFPEHGRRGTMMFFLTRNWQSGD